MSQKTNAVAVRTIGIDTGKEVLSGKVTGAQISGSSAAPGSAIQM
jgi:hypothetical protein